MSYYKNTTQVANVLFDVHLKKLKEVELKVLLIIIRRTLGRIDPNNSKQRVERAWISQKLFMLLTGASDRGVSSAIEGLVKKRLIVVTSQKGKVLYHPLERRGVFKLYYASRLRLDQKARGNDSKRTYHRPMKKSHTIKLKSSKFLYDNFSQGKRRLSDRERLMQILQNKALKRE